MTIFNSLVSGPVVWLIALCSSFKQGLNRKSLSLMAIMIVSIHGTSTALAQTDEEKQKISAVMSVITTFLLDGREPPIDEPSGTRVDIDLNQVLPNTLNVDDSVYAVFDLQEEGVEFCFDLTSNIALSPGDIVVEVNGEPVEAIEGADNCYLISEQQQRLINYIQISVVNPSVELDLSRVELAASDQSQLSIPRVTRGQWDEVAVRKVLKVFAFGGHATDVQIQAWADMYPNQAITQMLNFQEHNLLLSPLVQGDSYNDTATQHGKLTEFATFLSAPGSNLPIPASITNSNGDTYYPREQYGLDGYNFDDGFGRMITVRGLNPFRQRIGFWETNYHLAVNRDVGVSRRQVAAFYDALMESLESGAPYHEVIGVAAKSAAMAEQYGHDRNRWRYDRDLDEYVCQCNEDSAREYHQLYFGIFGINDPLHEDITIPNTAKMLTDMPIDNSDGPLDNIQVVFGTDDHHEDPLLISGNLISGADASEKIDNLMPLSIMHPESLAYLPVYIVAGLADDNLSEGDKAVLRQSWASMGQNKYFLDFIQAYAISTLFHSSSQYKYFTTHERALYLANKNNFENIEAYFGGGYYNGGRAGITVGSVISDDNAGDFFRPIHNVFGGQNSAEASDSALVFENNYNMMTDDNYRIRDAVMCEECDLGNPWEKRWDEVLPQRDGQYYVSDAAEWMWRHAVGSMDNYTELEKAHLYALLGATRKSPGNYWDQDQVMDFSLLMCIVEDYQRQEGAQVDISLQNIFTTNVWRNYCTNNDEGQGNVYSQEEREALNRVYTGQDIADNPEAQALLTELGNATLPLLDDGSDGADEDGYHLREHARERLSSALGFIFTTPFVFAEGQ